MSDVTKRAIKRNLFDLVREYERLSTERTFLMNGVADRLVVVNAERQEIVTEAQAQLDRLNTFRVADGEAALTLQEVRDLANSAPRVRPQ